MGAFLDPPSEHRAGSKGKACENVVTYTFSWVYFSSQELLNLPLVYTQPLGIRQNFYQNVPTSL